jgi:transcriptional regulator
MNCTIETVSQPAVTKPVELELTGCAVGPAPCQGMSACRVITLRPAMYVPDSYRAPNPEAALEIIAANPWAVLVSCTDEGPLASHLPVILDREGELGATLLGHLARANPHSRLLTRTKALVIFEGANGYVSPVLYERTPAAPTHDYVAVHVHGAVKLITEPEQALAVVLATAELFEEHAGTNWDLGPSLDYAQGLLSELVAFRVDVERIDAAFKLSQEQDPATQERIAAAFASEPARRRGDLAAAIHRYVPPRWR